MIAFTGSSAVGLEILRGAAEARDGQPHIKRVVAEMGGKNCVIVDSDADLDEAVPGIVDSAFGYAGQKCSAASRVLVHEAVDEPLVERLARSGRGAGGRPGRRARGRGAAGDRARGARAGGRYAELGRRAGAGVRRGPRRRLVLLARVACELPTTPPCLPRRSSGRCWRCRRASVEAACDRVDLLPFALTGGLFSRSPGTVD